MEETRVVLTHQHIPNRMTSILLGKEVCKTMIFLKEGVAGIRTWTWKEVKVLKEEDIEKFLLFY